MTPKFERIEIKAVDNGLLLSLITSRPSKYSDERRVATRFASLDETGDVEEQISTLFRQLNGGEYDYEETTE